MLSAVNTIHLQGLTSGTAPGAEPFSAQCPVPVGNEIHSMSSRLATRAHSCYNPQSLVASFRPGSLWNNQRPPLLRRNRNYSRHLSQPDCWHLDHIHLIVRLCTYCRLLLQHVVFDETAVWQNSLPQAQLPV